MSELSPLPRWMFRAHEFRTRFIQSQIEPMVVLLFGPLEEESLPQPTDVVVDEDHRRLNFLPNYVEDVSAFREASMSLATLVMLFVVMTCLFLVFVSCFYHNQKTSPLFISPRRHRLPKLVPPPLPVDRFFSWVKVCFYLSDEEIINRVGYDSLIFMRFHRLALRCIVKMSLFSFAVLLPLNFFGGGHANASDLKGYVGSLLFTDFLRFTMANVSGGSPRLWVHCFAAYLLTGIVVRELLVEYEAFNSIRHRYLLSREPHLRSVLVTNIPRHLRAPNKIDNYFRHVYPSAVKSVAHCQNLIRLERMIRNRTSLLNSIESELLMLCRSEKRRLFQQTRLQKFNAAILNCDGCTGDTGIFEGAQERLARQYTNLEEINEQIVQELRRRKRVMKKMNRLEAGVGRSDIDYVLASPFFMDDPKQRQQRGVTNTETERGYRPPTIGAPRNADGSFRSSAKTDVLVHESSEVSKIQPDPTSKTSDGAVLRTASPSFGKSSNAVDANSRFSAEPSVPVWEEDVYKKKKRKAFSKARHALKKYMKLARDITFFGRPATTETRTLGQGHIEDHVNEVTDKAFVTMNTFTASTIAIQSMHSSKPGSMQVRYAPEPRDILWDNVYVSKGALRTRSYIGEVLVLLLIAFYVVPVALVSLLVSESALVSSSPRLEQLAQASAFFSSAIAMVQPLCIVALQQLLPPLFMFIGRSEGLLSFSEVQMRAFSRYFLFQVVNVFLVTTIAGSIFDTIAIIVENPEAAFEMLGNSLPRMSSFFITFATIKTFLGLGLELVRTMSLVQASLRYILFPNATLRSKRNPKVGMRAIDDPGWFPFHKILAQDTLVVVVSVVFAVVAPLVLLPCALFCLFSRIMWTHHHLYVYESIFETGGQFWPKVFRRFVFGLIIAQMTITGQFILKEARHEAYATIALMFMTYLFLRFTRARYDPSSSTLPLEVATVMDISLAQEEEAMRRTHEQNSERVTSFDLHESEKRTQDGGDFEQDLHEHFLGSKVGLYDPFDQAYLQPALRANPRARPEQPFPPGQLGREEAFWGDKDGRQSGGLGVIGESELCDTGATVRLKSLNQQDRRLINRWWNDQFQRAGKQNLLGVLIGAECGTLMIGNGANVVEMNKRREGGVMV